MLQRMREKREQTRQHHEMEKISIELKAAAALGKWEVVKKIVSEYGTNDTVINTPRLTDNEMPAETALTLAVQNGFIETVKELLQAACINANTNNYADQMNTPLLNAILLGHADIAIALAGMPNINVNMVGGMGISPLIYAVYHCQDALPALIAAKSLSINLCDQERRTALMHAILNPVEARNTVPKPVVLLMNARDADLDVRDGKGMTALMLAAKRGNAAIVDALLDAGANPALVNYASQSAEEIAIQFKHEDVAEVFRSRAAKKEEVSVKADTIQQQQVTEITPVAAPANIENSAAAEPSRRSVLADSKIMRFFTRAKFNAAHPAAEPEVNVGVISPSQK